MSQADGGASIPTLSLSGVKTTKIDYRWGMGFERPQPRKFKGMPYAAPRPHHLFLHQYGEMVGSYLEQDVEAEQCTWPEFVDQTKLARWCGPYDFDDQEDDDPPGGDIVDEPHDAREEDGI